MTKTHKITCFILGGLVLISSICLGQNEEISIKVQYEYFRIPKTSPFTIRYNSILLSDGNASTYTIDLKSSDSLENITNDKGSYTMLKESKNPVYYKNLNEQFILNKERILLKKIVVIDTLGLFQWTLTQEKKNILGKQCYAATTNFRGRQYKAYFTTEVPVQNGPWKFHGLPGLILEVADLDGSFRMTATAIELKAESLNITNPYLDADIMTRDGFESLYKRKYKEVNAFAGEDGSTMKMSRGLIEIIVEEEGEN